MPGKTPKQLHDELSWNTKIYTLLAISVALFAKFFEGLEEGFALTIILSLLVILFVESFVSISVHHPVLFRLLRWLVILLALAAIVIGLT